MEEPTGSPRRLRLLLPLLTRPLDGPALPHAAVLDESRSPSGVVLWQMLQDTTLWIAGQMQRAGLFADEAQSGTGWVPDVDEELKALSVLVRDPHPDAGPIIARLCDRVRLWAERTGLLDTALAFAQVAALADLETAPYAYEVGRLARRRAEYARSELWYQRAAGLAKRHGDQKVRALSYSGLANLHSQRGNFAEARRLMERAARVVPRRCHREILGAIYHGLAVLEFELGAVRRGMEYARGALRVFGPGHDQTPVVVQDMAVALMDRCGAFAAARQVLAAVIPHVRQREVRQLGLANLGRAAGATGERELFEAVWTDCWPRLGDPADPGHNDALVADGLVALARGAASLHNFDRARQAAERALALSHGRREGKSLYLAESLLCAIDADQRVQEGAEPDSSPDPALTTFARDLLRACAHRPPPADDTTESLRAILDHPSDARRAYQVGRALRAEGEYGRAEAWLERGVQLARNAGDRVVEAMCLGALGNLNAQRGSLAAALEIHRQHLNLARREGLREMEAYALVDLCATSFMLDLGEEGFSYAREALILLEPGNPLLPRLAHDLAMYLLDSRGDFENALLLFQALQRHEFPRDERLLLASSLARAAAGAGQAQLFEDTWTTVWSELDALPVAQRPSLPFLMLAHGALIRGYNDLADEAARRGLAAASARGERRHVSGAEELIEAAAVARKTQARAPAPRHPTHNGHAAARLTREFVAGLRKGAARSSRAARSPRTSSSSVEL